MSKEVGQPDLEGEKKEMNIQEARNKGSYPNIQSLPPQPMAESGQSPGSRLPRTVPGTQDAVSDSPSPTSKQANGC